LLKYKLNDIRGSTFIYARVGQYGAGVNYNQSTDKEEIPKLIWSGMEVPHYCTSCHGFEEAYN